MKIIVWTIIILVTAIFLVGFIPKMLNQRELKRMEQETVGAVKIVRTVEAKQAPSEETGLLPGNISAVQYATIFARVDGYLKSRLADIGDHVKTGQLLAQIDTPTIDEEVSQAEADLAQAKAQVISAKSTLLEARAKDKAAQAEVERAQADQQYTEVTAGRWERMAQKGAVSIQSRDEKNRANLAQTATLQSKQADKVAADETVSTAESQVKVAQAEMKAKQASLSRTQAKQNFKFVRAPFDGVITVRKVDPGALITAGSQSQTLELFQLARIDDLRIYINAPQTVARYLQTGQKATVLVPEFPERQFVGEITNVAGGLDPQTRTRQTEIHINNRDHALLPGMYAQVKLVVERPDPWLKIDSNAVVPRDNTTQVVVVNDKKAHYRTVVVGRDFGDTVEIKAGLSPGDQVVVSPPVDLREWEPVNPSPLEAATSVSH